MRGPEDSRHRAYTNNMSTKHMYEIGTLLAKSEGAKAPLAPLLPRPMHTILAESRINPFRSKAKRKQSKIGIHQNFNRAGGTLWYNTERNSTMDECTVLHKKQTIIVHVTENVVVRQVIYMEVW